MCPCCNLLQKQSILITTSNEAHSIQYASVRKGTVVTYLILSSKYIRMRQKSINIHIELLMPTDVCVSLLD